MKELVQQLEALASQLAGVHINEAGIEQFVHTYAPEQAANWLTVSPFNIAALTYTEQLHFVFLLNSVSFSYWGTPKWCVEYNGHMYDGAQGMIAALGRAYQEDVPILDPTYWAKIDVATLQEVLRGNTEIPLLHERVMHIQEVGRVIMAVFAGSVENVLTAADSSAEKLFTFIIEHFPSFADVRHFKGTEIHFNKRAQLLVSDIHHMSQSSGLHGIENLTACADYKLPQVLRRYGILEYSPKLKTTIHALQPLAVNSQEEIAIRIHTILAVEKITERLKAYYPDVTANTINDYLWLEGQKKLPNDEPYHRTRTTAY